MSIEPIYTSQLLLQTKAETTKMKYAWHTSSITPRKQQLISFYSLLPSGPSLRSYVFLLWNMDSNYILSSSFLLAFAREKRNLVLGSNPGCLLHNLRPWHNCVHLWAQLDHAKARTWMPSHCRLSWVNQAWIGWKSLGSKVLKRKGSARLKVRSYNSQRL